MIVELLMAGGSGCFHCAQVLLAWLGGAPEGRFCNLHYPLMPPAPSAAMLVRRNCRASFEQSMTWERRSHACGLIPVFYLFTSSQAAAETLLRTSLCFEWQSEVI